MLGCLIKFQCLHICDNWTFQSFFLQYHFISTYCTRSGAVSNRKPIEKNLCGLLADLKNTIFCYVGHEDLLEQYAVSVQVLLVWLATVWRERSQGTPVFDFVCCVSLGSSGLTCHRLEREVKKHYYMISYGVRMVCLEIAGKPWLKNARWKDLVSFVASYCFLIHPQKFLS